MAIGFAINFFQSWVLRDVPLVYEFDLEVYVTNGAGQGTTKVLRRLKKRSGIKWFDPVYDSYFQPSLSPDGSKIACIRYTNYYPSGSSPEIVKIQKYEALIVPLDGSKETILYQLPGGIYEGPRGKETRKDVASPIWSLDGQEVFFLVGHRLLSYEVAGQKTREVAKLLEGHGANTFLPRHYYLGLSKDGKRILALVSGPGSKDSIWEIDIASGRLNKLWTGLLDHIWGRVRSLPEGLNDEAVQVLFGSRDFPVMAPQLSKDGRFYFYFMWREGLAARYWIGGFDITKKRQFTVKTLRRLIYTE